MKKLIKSDICKKIILVMLMITLIMPNYSHAGFLTSVINKPLQIFALGIVDTLNSVLTAVFALDSKIAQKDETEAGNIAGMDLSEYSQWFEDNIQEAEEGDTDTEKTEKIEKNSYLLISPEDVFSSKVSIADANVFKVRPDTGWKTKSTFGDLMNNLRKTVAGLYYMMRNIAVVILLSLLIYCGIRIVISSSNAGERAKWKMYLIDWVKALAFVMFIHVIIIGIFFIAESITEALGGMSTGNIAARLHYDVTDNLKSNWKESTSTWLSLIMYGYITYLTFVFIIAYFKRLMYVIVLIIVSPIVSSLYALGKTSKGTFNGMITEFIFGVMIQPFHFLVYTILLAIPMTAGDFTTTLSGKIFALIALSMIRPIEKYLRRTFGFGKATLDNLASYESGKKTLDAGKNAAKQVARTGATIGLAVATGGASLASSMGGLLGGQGGTPEETDDPNNPNNPTNPNAPGGPGGILDRIGRNGTKPGEESNRIGTENGENYDSYYDEQPLFDKDGNPVGQQEPIDGDVINSQKRNMDEAELNQFLDAYRESGYDDYDLAENEKNMRLLGYGKTLNDDELNDYLERMQADLSLDSGKREELENSMRALGHGMSSEELKADELGDELGDKLGDELGNKLADERNFDINSAIVNINSADEIGAQQVQTLTAEDIQALEGDVETEGEVEAEKVELEESDNNKDENNLTNGDIIRNVLGGGALATALGNFSDKHAQIKDSIENSPIYKALTSADARNSLQDARASMHEFADSFALPSDVDPSFWKASVELKREKIKEVQEKNILNFVNDKNHQKQVIDALGLKDTVDKNGQVHTKEDKAKEKLKEMQPFVNAGISSPIQIMNLQKIGGTPKEAMKIALKQDIANNIGEVRYQSVKGKEENKQQMRSIVADGMGIPQERRNDVKIVQTINQQVEQKFEECRKYIESGAAKDSQTAVMLTDLEKKIDQKVNMIGSARTPKETYVERSNVIIERTKDKAIKQNGGAPLNNKQIQDFMKKNPIKLNGASSNIAVKELQGVLNQELGRRLSDLNTKGTYTSPTVTKTIQSKAPSSQITNNNTRVSNTTNVNNARVSNTNVSNTTNTRVNNNNTRINNNAKISNNTNINNTSVNHTSRSTPGIGPSNSTIATPRRGRPRKTLDNNSNNTSNRTTKGLGSGDSNLNS